MLKSLLPQILEWKSIMEAWVLKRPKEEEEMKEKSQAVKTR